MIYIETYQQQKESIYNLCTCLKLYHILLDPNYEDELIQNFIKILNSIKIELNQIT